MKKLSHILIPVLILISPLGCGEVVKTYYESRTESLVFSDKNVKNDKCVLKREVHKHFIIYQYDCEVDSKSNLEFHFSIQSNLLTIGNTEFKSESSTITFDEFSEFPFKKYQRVEQKVDATGPIIFNEEYGVLAILNVYGPDSIFLPKNLDLESILAIRAKITE